MTAIPAIPSQSGARHFSPEENAQVVALFDAIWPGAEDRPGAREAGAADYVDQLLAQPDSVYYDIANWRKAYADGLAMLSAIAIARFGPGTRLAELPRANIIALLTELSGGTLAGTLSSAAQKDFFVTLRGHCIEGCVGDPRWGGNRGRVIWSWLGYPNGGAHNLAPGRNIQA